MVHEGQLKGIISRWEEIKKENPEENKKLSKLNATKAGDDGEMIKG